MEALVSSFRMFLNYVLITTKNIFHLSTYRIFSSVKIHEFCQATWHSDSVVCYWTKNPGFPLPLLESAEGPLLKMPHTDGGERSRRRPFNIRPRSSNPVNKIIHPEFHFRLCNAVFISWEIFQIYFVDWVFLCFDFPVYRCMWSMETSFTVVKDL